MQDLDVILVTLGGLFLLGLVTDLLGRHTPLPRVTLLLVVGFLVGPSGFDILPDTGRAWFASVGHLALVMVGFLLGGKITAASLREHGRDVICISIAQVTFTIVLVLGALLLVGTPLVAALLLAGIAPATAPAATADVVSESGADGPFSRTLLGIVAVDDAWGLIAFSLLLAVAESVQGGVGAATLLMRGLWELGGAILLGVCLGIPMAQLTGRIEPGEPTLAEALGMVLLCGGVALWLGVSFLLACMVLGCVVSNTARHHHRPFHAIEGIEWPFMILFFVLAGASLEVESVAGLGVLGAAYVLARIGGRLAGAWVGGAWAGSPPLVRRWMGMALMPQAGVALGLALIAAQRFGELGETLLPVVIGATVLFELIGPVLTRRALVLAGEAVPRERRSRAGEE
jgi:Kef-type K+ transport system membrane component KefB